MIDTSRTANGTARNSIGNNTKDREGTRSMKRITSPLIAAALVAAGIAGDRVVGPVLGSASAAAGTAAPAIVSTTTNTTTDSVAEHAFAMASPSIVYVSNVGVGSGSGVIYDASGDIVTNAHVVANAQSLRVTLKTGQTYPARLVGTDTADDLAVIHINAALRGQRRVPGRADGAGHWQPPGTAAERDLRSDQRPEPHRPGG